jgi:hypothetical protein
MHIWSSPGIELKGGACAPPGFRFFASPLLYLGPGFSGRLAQRHRKMTLRSTYFGEEGELTQRQSVRPGKEAQEFRKMPSTGRK